MGLFRKVSKAVKKATKAVSNPISQVTKSVEKIAQGKVSEGLGDLGQGAASMGLDIATGGNKKVVDQLSGGLLTSAELAARGNSKDIVRVGLTGGAALVGGAPAALMVNSAMAQGHSPLQAIFSAGAQGLVGDNMKISSVLSDIQSSTGINVGDVLTNLLGVKSDPQSSTGSKAVVQGSAPSSPVIIQQPSGGGINTNVMMIAGAGLVGVVLLALLLKRK